MRNQLCAAFAAFTVLTAGAAAQLTPLVDYYQRWAASGAPDAPRYRKVSGQGAVDAIRAACLAELRP